ncbi:hypothetical protein PJI17_31355, partial [Mycobacterium kansasii]
MTTKTKTCLIVHLFILPAFDFSIKSNAKKGNQILTYREQTYGENLSPNLFCFFFKCQPWGIESTLIGRKPMVKMMRLTLSILLYKLMLKILFFKLVSFMLSDYQVN